ncbi:porin family protein [Hymenobacter bucti]|uniref:Porin family protein n=1 Tax=Hymenobacter bucti TaxID=1844114 RepID=A0ABW4QQS0_9BACT
MKKSILVLLAFMLVFSTVAQAQRRGRSSNDVSLGLKAGASMTNLVGDYVKNQNFDNLFGFHAGVFANITLTQLFAFQPELLYSQKGYKSSAASNYNLRLHYIDVPLAFHVNTGGLFFEAGPQVGFLVAAKGNSSNVSVDVKEGYNTVDFGYLFGLGYQLKHGLGVGLRYNGAFTNIDKATTIGSVTYQDKARNSAFQLYLTYSVNGH